uniref:Uncharacterized protein n=1 Tax=Picea glauca TaxID=3330 RepID=A0A101LWS4_PICGL|nr:hypothetical protein ABT39_MTgene6244 [Picea glauca]
MRLEPPLHHILRRNEVRSRSTIRERQCEGYLKRRLLEAL